MGLFSKKPKVAICDMCGKADVEGCGSADKHVEQMSGDQPAWLPANLRAQAQGQYTWLCLRCNSVPDMKWPSDSGAGSAMNFHLGKDHHVGPLVSIASAMPAPFKMRSLG